MARFADEGMRELPPPPLDPAEVERTSAALEAVAVVARALAPPPAADRASNPALHLNLPAADAVTPRARSTPLLQPKRSSGGPAV